MAVRVDGRVGVRTAVAVLPAGRQHVSSAVAAGVVSAEEAAAFEMTELPVASADEPAEALALQAAGRALSDAGVAATDVGFIVGAWQREDEGNWKAALRLARQLGARRAVAFGIQQLCNAGAMGLQLAISHLMAELRTDHALVVTGDTLGAAGMRRWQLNGLGAPMGDAATAVLLSRGGGRLSVRAIHSSGRPEQEACFPPGNLVTAGPPMTRPDPEADGAVPSRPLLLRHSVREAVQAACADAGVATDDPRLAVVMMPRINSSLLRVACRGVLEVAEKTRVVHLTAGTGHLFAGDLGANLAHLLDEDLLAPGELGLVLNVGGGWNATCLVVEA